MGSTKSTSVVKPQWYRSVKLVRTGKSGTTGKAAKGFRNFSPTYEQRFDSAPVRNANVFSYRYYLELRLIEDCPTIVTTGKRGN